MEIYIRPALTQDLPELIALQSLALSTFYVDDYEPVQTAALIKSQADARKLGVETILVAEASQKIVGFASISNAMQHIEALYVHPEYLQQGIGKTLLTMLEEIAVNRKCHILRVITSSTVASFYQSQGYEVKRPYNYKTRSGVCIPCQLLEKQLLPANPALDWLGQHPVVILLLLSVWLGVNIYYFQKQNRQFPEDQNVQPQLNFPSRDRKML